RITSNNKLLIPVLESDRLMNLIFRMRVGPPKYQSKAHKALSRATYFIDESFPTGGFFAKFVPHIPFSDEKLKRELLVNDLIKSQLSRLPESLRDLTMDSFAYVNLSVFGIPYALLYRSANQRKKKLISNAWIGAAQDGKLRLINELLKLNF